MLSVRSITMKMVTLLGRDKVAMNLTLKVTLNKKTSIPMLWVVFGHYMMNLNLKTNRRGMLLANDWQ